MMSKITCLLNKINLSKMNRYKHEKLTRILITALLVVTLLSVFTISFMHLSSYAADDISSNSVTELAGSSWYISNYTYTGSNQGYIVSGQLTYSGGTVTLPYPTTLQLKSTELSFGNGGWDDSISISVSDWCIIRFDSVSASGSSDLNILTILFNEYGIQLKVTDLTDTTWNVPAGWEAEAGYFYGSCIQYEANGSYYTELYLGYSNAYNDTASNYITFFNMGDDSTSTITNDEAFTIFFYDGDDPKLIAWLSKYGQLQGSEEPEPELGTFTVYYGLDDPRNYELSFVLGMTFGDWVENTTYNTIGSTVVSGYDKYDGELYTCISLGENIDAPEVSYGTNYNVFGLPKGGGFVKPDTVIVDGSNYSVDTATLYDESFAKGYSLGWNSGYDSGESAGELRGYNNGFSDGKIEGIEEGYAQGYSKGESDSFVHGFFGNFLSGIVHAIDSIHFYEYTIDDMGTPDTNDDEVFYISPWSIFVVFIGLALVIIFLKVFRGG